MSFTSLHPTKFRLIRHKTNPDYFCIGLESALRHVLCPLRQLSRLFQQFPIVLAVPGNFSCFGSSGICVIGSFSASALPANELPLCQLSRLFRQFLAIPAVPSNFGCSRNSGFCVTGNFSASTLPTTTLPLCYVFSRNSFSQILSAPQLQDLPNRFSP